MCLTVTSKNYPKNILQKIFGIQPKIKPLIAKKDIICYKAYIETDIFGVVKSPYQKTLNLVGKPLPTVELGINDNYRSFILIDEGYHTFVNEPNLNDFLFEYVMYECIIPKGSIYYLGDYDLRTNNGYVSNNLIINKKISEGN